MLLCPLKTCTQILVAALFVEPKSGNNPNFYQQANEKQYSCTVAQSFNGNYSVKKTEQQQKKLLIQQHGYNSKKKKKNYAKLKKKKDYTLYDSIHKGQTNQ